MATASSSADPAMPSFNTPHDPLWRYTQQIQLLTQLLAIDASDHAKEFELVCLAHRYCAMLSKSVDDDSEDASLCDLSAATLDEAAQKLAADGAVAIWRPEDTTNQQLIDNIKLFFHFLVSLTLACDTSTLFGQGEHVMVHLEIPGWAYYACLTRALIMIANYPSTSILIKQANQTTGIATGVAIQIPERDEHESDDENNDEMDMQEIEMTAPPKKKAKLGEGEMLKSKWPPTLHENSTQHGTPSGVSTETDGPSQSTGSHIIPGLTANQPILSAPSADDLKPSTKSRSARGKRKSKGRRMGQS